MAEEAKRRADIARLASFQPVSKDLVLKSVF